MAEQPSNVSENAGTLRGNTIVTGFDAISRASAPNGLGGGPAVTVFGGQLNGPSAALAAGGTPWRPGTGSVSATDRTESARVGAGPRNMALGSGPASALLTGHAEANAATMTNNLNVTHVADMAELTNSTVAHPMRFGYADQTYKMPGVHHLSFIKTRHARTARAMMPTPPTPNYDFNPGAVADGRGPQLNSINVADMNSQMALHVYAMNEMLFVQQYKMFKENIVAYSKFNDPSDIMRGHPDLLWTGWMIDGIVLHESIADGGSSKFNDGYMSNSVRNQLMRTSGSTRPPESRTKKLTTTGSGRSKMADTFNGRGLNVGSTQWLILTKKHNSRYKTATTFTLSTKAGPYSPENGSGVIQQTYTVESLEDQQRMGKTAEEQSLYKALTHGFCPYQFFFLSVPDGGNPLMAFKEYEDEWGFKHYNAHRMPLSRLVFEPYQYERLPPITSPLDSGFQAATNGGEALSRKPIEGVLLYPAKDGYRDFV